MGEGSGAVGARSGTHQLPVRPRLRALREAHLLQLEVGLAQLGEQIAQLVRRQIGRLRREAGGRRHARVSE